MANTRKVGLTTQLIHGGGYDPASEQGDIIPPLHLTSTYAFKEGAKYDYSRSGNPTRGLLESTLAVVDQGTHALAFSSGSAALATVAALLSHGEEVLFSKDAYGGTYRYITQVLARQGYKHRLADFTDLNNVAEALLKHPIKLVWIETPTNPLLKVADIAAIAKLVHGNGAILAVDNTFATPVIQQPLTLGADVVTYSTTKYINGHSDSIGGSLAMRDEDLYQRLKFLQNAIGAILSPFDSWLTLRGLRTLELRVRQHVTSAQAIARLLVNHPKIKKVYYPGLLTGQQGEIVHRQMKLPGAIVSVELDPAYDVQQFLAALKYIPLAESLGGVESLIDHPATMTHAAIPREERDKIGLKDELFRISVGIENVEDLLSDIAQALDAAKKKKGFKK